MQIASDERKNTRKDRCLNNTNASFPSTAPKLVFPVRSGGVSGSVKLTKPNAADDPAAR